MQRATRQILRTYASGSEQPRYYKIASRAVTRADRAAARGSSVGRITNMERRAIRSAAKATRLITTPGEAQGVKKVLRRKARKS